MTQIVVKAIDVSEAPKILEESQKMLATAKNMPIITHQAYISSDTLLKAIKLKSSNLDARRKEITGPLDKAKASVMALFKPPLSLLKEAEQIIKDAQLKYLDEQEKIRRDKEEKLRQKAEAERRKKEAQEAELRRKEEEKRREAEALAAKAAKAKDTKTRVDAQAAADKATAEADRAAAKAEIKGNEAATVVAPTIAPVEIAKGSAVVIRWYAEVVDKKLVPIEYMVPNMKLLNDIAPKMKDNIKIPGVVFKSERGISSRKATEDVGF